jgi:hypothetical protein
MKRPSLKVIENRFAALQAHCQELVKEVIGNWCKENNARFSYGFDVTFQILIANDQVDEDGNLIADPEIHCRHHWRHGYYYDAEPDAEVINVLEKYEEMFGNWYQSDCTKGEWRGI